jgi:hypothetical protein
MVLPTAGRFSRPSLRVKTATDQKFFTPAQLLQWAREDPLQLLLAGLREVGQLQQRSGLVADRRVGEQAASFVPSGR